MNDKNLTTGSLDMISYRNNENVAVREYPLIEVELHGRTHKVRVLSEDEAKAKICEEYGFAYGSIRIESTCWYEATDMNYFKFCINGRWIYEARDFEPLELLDFHDSRPYRNYHPNLDREPPYFNNGLPAEYEAKKVRDLTAWPFHEDQPGELWETKDGGRAIVFPNGGAVLVDMRDLVNLAVQVQKY